MLNAEVQERERRRWAIRVQTASIQESRNIVREINVPFY